MKNENDATTSIDMSQHQICAKKKNYLDLSLGYDSKADLIEALQFAIEDLENESFTRMFETEQWHYFAETEDDSLFDE